MKIILSAIMVSIFGSVFGQDFTVIKELLNEGKLKAAKESTQQLLIAFPESAEAHYWLGTCMYRFYSSNEFNPNKDLKSIIDAGIAFEKAEYLDSQCAKKADDFSVLKGYSGKTFNLGVLSYQKKELDMAFTYFKMATNASDWMGALNKESLYYTGHCANKIEDYRTAKNFLEKLVSVDPTNTKAVKELLKSYRNLNELNQAKILLKSSLVQTPNEASLWYELIDLSAEMNEPEESLKAARTLSHLDATNPENLAYLAGFYNETGDKDKAMSTYTDCLSHNASHKEANHNLGVLYYNDALKLHGVASSLAEISSLEEVLINAELYLNKAKDLDLGNIEIDMLINNIQKMK
ncbi:MAG: hypothetical protein QNK63_02910 [Flavobacteriales bacterium]